MPCRAVVGLITPAKPLLEDLSTHFVPHMNKYAKNGPLISFPYASVLRSRMEPSARLSERSRNICKLKTKHLSHRCKRMGNMCESRPGSHSVFSNIHGPESDGNRLSRCNSNQMHVQPTPHLFLALFTAKIYQLLTLLTAGQFTAHDVLRAFMPTRARFADSLHASTAL